MSEVNDLLAKIAEPETPEERDAAWNEVADRLAESVLSLPCFPGLSPSEQDEVIEVVRDAVA